MSLDLRPTASVRKRVLKILGHQIDEALDQLRAPEDYPNVVHATRKRLKRARALIRLVRKGLGDRLYHHANLRLRDAARPLAAARDAEILVETVDEFFHLCATSQERLAVAKVRSALIQQRDAMGARAVSTSHALAQAEAILAATRSELPDWPMRSQGWDAIAPGLRKVYKKARAALATARKDGSAANLHELRKQTNYLLNELRVLEPVWSKGVRRAAANMKRLTQALGSDHDLAVLAGRLETDLELALNGGTLQHLRNMVTLRHQQIVPAALSLAQEIYAEGAAGFIAPLAKNWRRENLTCKNL